MGDDCSRDLQLAATAVDEDYEASAAICERLEREPGDLRGEYVGVVQGRIVIADHDFRAVAKKLQRVEPDRSRHSIVLAGSPQPSVIHNFRLES